MTQTQHAGLTMDWSICSNGYGKPVVHGWVGGVHVLSCQMLRADIKRAEEIVRNRLETIALEAGTERCSCGKFHPKEGCCNRY